MFYNCCSLISIPYIYKWNANKDLQMNRIFDDCPLLSPNSIYFKNILFNKLLIMKELFNISNRYIMIYKIPKNKEFIRIIGYSFILNNSEETRIIYKEEIFPLTEELEIKDIKENILKLEIIFSENVCDLSSMFENCDLLLQFKEYDELDNSNNINFKNNDEYKNERKNKFYIKNDLIINTNKYTNFSKMFSNCTSLISLPDFSKWNNSKVYTMSRMFEGCISLSSLPDISKWNTSKVNGWYVHGMFIFNLIAEYI